MTEKSLELLFFLISIPAGVELSRLARQFQLSERRIYALIEEIKEFIKAGDYGRLDKQGNKYQVQLKSKEKLKELLLDRAVICRLPGLRRLEMWISIISGEKETAVRDLETQFAVSRTVIKSDLEELHRQAENYQVELQVLPFKGIWAQAPEGNLRRVLIALFGTAIRDCCLSGMDILAMILTELEMCRLKDIILSGEESVLKFIPDQLLSYFAVCLGVTMARIRGNHLIPPDFLGEQEMHETRFAEQLLSKITGFGKEWSSKRAETLFLAELIAGIPKVDYPLEDSHKTDWIFFQILLKKFIKAMADYLHFPFLRDEKLFRGLLQHLYPAYIRMRNGQMIENPIFSETVQAYSLEYHAVKQQVYLLEEGLKVRFTDEECAYLTLFFAASRKREEKKERRLLRVRIVCSAGVSTSYLLTTQLENLFSVEVVGISSQRTVAEDIQKESSDFIVSTVDLAIAQEYIKVSPILSEPDIQLLAACFNGFREKIKIKPLVQMIQKYAVIIDEESLTEELNGYLNQEKTGKEKEEIMLREILTESLIELNSAASRKEEAITAAGELLLANGLIEPQYIKAMLENVEKNGNYIVIAPGIAMPHARPEEGAKKIGMSIVTLAQPVVFGHKTNDPVRLVIGLCAVDHESHLKALAELIELLMKPQAVENILTAKSKKEVLHYLLGGENNG